MSTYGKKGGDGPTKGRKAETIYAHIAGWRYAKRVFKGQRFLVVAQSEADHRAGKNDLVIACETEAEAKARNEACRKLGYEFHGWAPAYVSVDAVSHEAPSELWL